MWYENHYVDHARMLLGVPVSPMWITSAGAGYEVGVASTQRRGHFYVFSSMCAFLTASEASHAAAAASGLSQSEDNKRGAVARYGHSCNLAASETVLFRISYESIESVLPEGDASLRIVARGHVYKFTHMEERAAVMNALAWLTAHAFHTEELDEIQRSAIIYPLSTRKVKALSQRNEQAEYVLQEIDGAIVTNHRLMFATTVVKLSSIKMVHIGEEDVKIIVSDSLTVQLRCSRQRQSLVSSVWLASLPIWSDLLSRVPEDPQKALKAHVKTLSRLHRQFCAIDTSRDGRLSIDEVRAAIGCLFCNETFVDGFYKALDEDSSGELSLQEFLGGIARLVTSNMMGRIRFTFEMFDVDRSGYLDREEMLDALRSLLSTGDVRAHESELKSVRDELFALMDEDHSGTISHEEYAHAVLHSPNAHAIFRRIGLYEGVDYFRMSLSEEPILVGSEQWFITAVVSQALLRGLHSAPRDNEERSSGKDLRPLDAAAYVQTEHIRINANSSVVAEFGQEWSGNVLSKLSESSSGSLSVTGSFGRRRSSFAIPPPNVVLEVAAPAVFDRIRTLHDIDYKSLRNSLGIDNIVGNMLLGSSTLLNWVKPLYASAHFFKFLSHDGEYLIRNITPEEKAALMLQLPQYVAHLMSNPNTLLQRYLGAFSLYTSCGHQLHFVLQLNAFRNPLHQPLPDRRPTVCFHASNYHIPMPPGGVDASELRAPIQLARGWKDPLLRQAAQDVQYLAAVGLSDYSVLAAVPELPAPETSGGGRSKTIMAALEAAAQSDTTPWNAQRAHGSKRRKWCCRSAVIKPQQGYAPPDALTLTHECVDTSVGAAAEYLDRKAFRRNLSRSSHIGGLFYSHDFGLPGAGSGVVTFAFINTLTLAPDRSQRHGISLLDQLEQLVQGESDSSGLPMNDSTARLYPITTETGTTASIGVDHMQRSMMIVGPQGQRLLLANLVLAKDDVSFVRDLHSFTARSRRRLGIRIGLRQARNGLRDFLDQREVYFENIVAREMFLSEARAVISGNGKEGAHVKSCRVFVVTWNVGERLPGDMTRLLQRGVHQDSDVIAVNVQDCTFPVPGFGSSDCGAYWVKRLALMLPQYVLVATTSVWSTRTSVFIKRSLCHMVSNIFTASTGTFLGSCNAVAVAMKLLDTSVCIINARFAQRGDAQSSTANFFEIMSGLRALESDGLDPLSSYHQIVFCGDLKYRCAAQLEDIINATRRNVFNELTATDQLIREMAAGEAYCGFCEKELTFRPTTKFLLDTDQSMMGAHDDINDSISSERIGGPAADDPAPPPSRVYDELRALEDEAPSWSHRILYRHLGHPIDEGNVVAYDADMSVKSSPSAPVVAVLEWPLRVQVVCATASVALHTAVPPVVAMRISNLRCTGLLQSEVCQVCDPYVRFSFPFFESAPYLTKSSVQRGTVNPLWITTSTFSLVPCERTWVVSEYLHFSVFDEGTSGQSDLLGVATLPMDRFVHTNTFDVALPILLHGRRNGDLSCTIELLEGERTS